MSKFIYAIVLAIIYGALGAFLEHCNIIVKPAFFSLYGVCWGLGFSFIWMSLVKGCGDKK